MIRYALKDFRHLVAIGSLQPTTTPEAEKTAIRELEFRGTDVVSPGPPEAGSKKQKVQGAKGQGEHLCRGNDHLIAILVHKRFSLRPPYQAW